MIKVIPDILEKTNEGLCDTYVCLLHLQLSMLGD
jgi:hypothetical protein